MFALVIGGNFFGVGVGDLDVVAKDLVEADLERVDAGAGAFLRLKTGDPFLAAARAVAELVKLRLIARPNQAALTGTER